MIEALVVIISFALFFAGSITENCATWAVRKRLFHGGRLRIRPSGFADDVFPPERRRGWLYGLFKRVPHFLWESPDGGITQYTVKASDRMKMRGRFAVLAWLRLWFYDGEVVPGEALPGDTVI